jgi:hypothetical protein
VEGRQVRLDVLPSAIVVDGSGRVECSAEFQTCLLVLFRQLLRRADSLGEVVKLPNMIPLLDVVFE